MIRYAKGDILQAEVEALVSTVNCVGVMGRGIALEFKKTFPENYKSYSLACKRGEVYPGTMFVYETGRIWPRYIINFPTKRHWRGKSRITDIEQGLFALANEIRTRNIRSVAIPPLGCGLGGLDWNEVRALIKKALSPLQDVDILVFEPIDAAKVKRNNSTDVPKMTEGRAALVGLMEQYLSALLDSSISLIEVHKLMYFLQAAGEPLKLRFVKAHYGPYAENLRHVIRAIDGHLITGYSNGGDNPDKQLNLVPGAIQDANKFLENHPATCKRFRRVRNLVEGFETPVGLELLSTVHWLITQERVQDSDDLVQAVHNWIPRKLKLTPAQIKLAKIHLESNGWTTVEKV